MDVVDLCVSRTISGSSIICGSFFKSKMISNSVKRP